MKQTSPCLLPNHVAYSITSHRPLCKHRSVKLLLTMLFKMSTPAPFHIPFSFFLNYILLIIRLQLSQFSLFAPLHPAPPTPSGHPPPLFMSMSQAYKFFGFSISYAVLYIPVAILFVLFNPLISSPIPLHLPPIWQPSKHSLYP